MDFAGTGVSDHLDYLAGGRPPDYGVVDNDDAFPLEDLPYRVQLDLHPEVANRLLRFNEGPADVVIADQSQFERQPGLLGIAHGGRNSGVGYGDDQVRFHAMLAGKLPPHLLSDHINVLAEDKGVRTGKVDKFEDTGLGRHLFPRHAACHAVLVDDYHLPGLQFPDEFGFYQVESAAFRGDHIGLPQLPETKRAESVRVPGGYHPAFGQEE